MTSSGEGEANSAPRFRGARFPSPQGAQQANRWRRKFGNAVARLHLERGESLEQAEDERREPENGDDHEKPADERREPDLRERAEHDRRCAERDDPRDQKAEG